MGAVFFWIIVLAAWSTHVIDCFTEERYLLLIAGAIAFPLAIVNGVWIWLS